MACDTEDEKFCGQKLYNAASNGRRTGSWNTRLGRLLSRLNLKYDSDEGIEVIEKIYKVIRDSAYSTSIEFRKKEGFVSSLGLAKRKNQIFMRDCQMRISKEMQKYGRRNISILTNAPTGSVSIMSQVSSGIEPVFKNSYTRRRKLNHDEKDKKADFVDDLGDKWIEFEVFHHNAQEYLDSKAQ